MGNRQAENLIWAADAGVIVIYLIVFAITAESVMLIPGIVFGVLMLILLCATVFAQGKQKQGYMVAYAILGAGLMFMCGKLWCGIPVLTVTALFSCYEFVLSSKKNNILINLFFLAGFTYWSRRLTPEKLDLNGYIFVAAILIFGIIWSLVVYWLFRYFDMNANLEKALKASALDAMNERQLRMEIAENKNYAEENARLEERERISRDIHNAVGHTLSAATVTLDAAQMLMDTDTTKANQKIDQANERIHEAIGSVRSVVRTLDAEDDSVLVADYISSLKELIHNFVLDTELRVHHNLDMIKDDGKLHIGRAAFISSSISEMLTNGVKHGAATVFVILINLDGAHISVQVNDNGKGWGDISYEEKQMKLRQGFGLRKMSDYVKSNAGSFEVEGKDGFCVKYSLPR